MRALFQLVGLLAFSTCLAMDFAPPKPPEILRAIGSTDGVPMTLKRAMDPGDNFASLPVPKPGDWLDVHPEVGQSFEDFKKDDKSSSAVIRKFEIIGEAAKQIPENVKQECPSVPWKEMAGMRDKLIHFYFGVNYDLLWQTIKNRIPEIKPVIRQLLQELRQQVNS